MSTPRQSPAAQIQVTGLGKTYRVAKRRAGLAGAFASLFRREYHEVHGLHGVDFAIQPGELVGYIGPNGAGKSTTIKILAGILTPTAGMCLVNGRVPWLERRRHVADIGVVFGQRTQLWWDLPVVESFDLLRDIYRVDRQACARTLDELVALLDLAPLLDTPVRQLSLGQRMRCDLAAALLHQPSILFLDEPTIGLDAVSKLAVRHFVARLNREQGVTVLLTTHDMDDIEALCQRLIVVSAGTILMDGTVQQLRDRVSRDRHITVDFAQPDAEVPAALGRWQVGRSGSRVQFVVDAGQLPAADFIAALTAASQVRDLMVEHPPIEQIVADLYAGPSG